MKSLYPLVILFLSLNLISCFSDDDVAAIDYNMRVVGPSLDCEGAYLVQLLELDEEIHSNNVDNTFVAINLPDQYKITGLNIEAHYRAPLSTEHLQCTALGIVYPELFITEVLYSD